MREAIHRRDTLRFPISNRGVVNHGIHRSEAVDLIGHTPGFGNGHQIADDYRLRSGSSRHCVPSSLPVPSVQNYIVALLDQQLCGHSAEPIGRACDEHTRHELSFPFVFRLRSAIGADERFPLLGLINQDSFRSGAFRDIQNHTEIQAGLWAASAHGYHDRLGID
jgi:hypothetical protein